MILKPSACIDVEFNISFAFYRITCFLIRFFTIFFFNSVIYSSKKHYHRYTRYRRFMFYCRNRHQHHHRHYLQTPTYIPCGNISCYDPHTSHCETDNATKEQSCKCSEGFEVCIFFFIFFLYVP